MHGTSYTTTTVLFDDKYEILHNHVNLKAVAPVTKKEYYARGMTALLVAVLWGKAGTEAERCAGENSLKFVKK